MNQAHLWLKRFRVIYVFIVGFVSFMTYEMWSFYELNYAGLSPEAAAAFSAMFLAMVGMLKYALENSRQDSEHD